MTTDYVENYYNDTMKLVETMTIKSEITADRINELLVAKYGASGVNQYDRSTWKYYCNIAGEYHYDNEVMTVVSYDTLEEINFTKPNLALHKATREAYQYGTRAYKLLVNKYPKQEMLILGILYPADKAAAIEADDHSILSYPSDLVESQEVTLIRDLDLWIKRYMRRWNVTGFNVTDTLYPGAQFAILCANIYPRVLNMRLARCKTPEAHSFHIREFLASHGGLDQYIQYMTLEQKLFLYRNIDYIEHHAGTKANFAWLIEKLLSLRSIPISSYSVRHKSSFDESYLPDFIIRRKPLNTQYNVREQTEFTLDEILTAEESAATGNADYATEHKTSIDTKLRSSVSTVVKTKELESITVNYSNTMKINFTNVAISHWIYMSNNDMYPSVVNFKHPRTGEMVALQASDAYTYFFYLMAKANGFSIETIPEFACTNVSKSPNVTIDEITAVADLNYVDAEAYAKLLIANQPNLKKCVSKSDFHTLTWSIYKAHEYQWHLTSRVEHLYSRAIVEKMCKQMYRDTTVKTANYGKNYEVWLKANNLDNGDDFTSDEFKELIASIYKNASGQDTDPAVLFKAMHSAMIAILTKLSSYSIQILHDSTDQAVIPLNWAMVRLGDYVKDSSSALFIENHVNVFDAGTQYEQTWTTPEIQPVEVTDYDTVISEELTVNTSVSVSKEATADLLSLVRTSQLVVETNHEKLAYFNSLPYEERQDIPDFYQLEI